MCVDVVEPAVLGHVWLVLDRFLPILSAGLGLITLVAHAGHSGRIQQFILDTSALRGRISRPRFETVTIGPNLVTLRSPSNRP